MFKYLKMFEDINWKWDDEEEYDFNILTKVIRITDDYIEFDNGLKLLSEHEQDCCENHYLDFNHLDINDFEGLKFDLSDDKFFTRIENYGISLNSINGYPIRIPGYGQNNGWYSSNLTLVLTDYDKYYKKFDITGCQVISGD